MNEDYLWNRAGHPDPDTVRLERLLAPLRYKPPVPLRRKSRYAWPLAAAAAVIAAVVTFPFLTRGPLTAWQTSDGRHVRAGQIVETGKLQSRDTGEVTVDPGSRLRLVNATDREQHFELRRGVIHAFIWAPPGRFVVDTPSSKTIDLGCRYTLEVSEDGTGLLTVELGWVAFERNRRESFIPAGAACVTRPANGPGTPYFSDASARLTGALARFDTSGDPAALTTVIEAARPRDALTLWHLLVRTRAAQRAEVFDRLAKLVSLPRSAGRDAILRGDRTAMDAAWDALDLGAIRSWRNWERP